MVLKHVNNNIHNKINVTNYNEIPIIDISSWKNENDNALVLRERYSGE